MATELARERVARERAREARDTRETKAKYGREARGKTARGERDEQQARQERQLPTPTPKVEAILEKESGAADWAKRSQKPSSRVAEHVVFLVPGLLGFDNFATFGYFADRVASSLRASLEQAWQAPVPVVAVPVPPTASLRVRQQRLVKTLADRLHAFEHGYQDLQVHLVGHSTGGLDANLLTCEEPVGGGHFRDLDPRAPSLVSRIRSVTSIGSPHHGACFARDPVARYLRDRDLRGLPALAGLVSTFVLSSLGDMEAEELLWSARREAGKSLRFLREMASSWELLADLDPGAPAPLGKLRSGVRRRSFVTIAGTPDLQDGSSEPADAFFRALSARASGWATGAAEQGEHVKAALARLQRALDSDQADELVIRAAGTQLPDTIDAGHNDGVVNTARQLIDPGNDDELAGIVVGDHFDVVGYYDRHAWRLDRDGQERASHVVSGLLHSGSGFRDNQFFELYRRVAKEIAEAVV